MVGRISALTDMVRMPDFRFGPLLVSPSRRQVFTGDGHSLALEPRVMQVFLLLADHHDEVVSRAVMFDEIWGGVPVGDDSINRAVAGVRRTLELAPEAFELETIPRTGYRLSVLGEDGVDDQQKPLGRRALIGGSLALGVVAAVAGVFGLNNRYSKAAEAQQLVDEGRLLLTRELPSEETQGVSVFRRATAIDPGNAEAWGLLALALRNGVENGTPDNVSKAATAAQSAAANALAINPDQGDALTALATLQPEFGDWLNQERRLRNILKRAPNTIPAMHSLVLLLQSVGRCRASSRLNDQILALDPVDPVAMYRASYKHWILGNELAADEAIERAMAIWPKHPAVWSARLLIYAYTGRAAQALKLVSDRQSRPPNLPLQMIQFWEDALPALIDRPKITKTRVTLRTFSTKSPGYAYYSIMTFAALGLIDDAFEVANGYYLKQGPLSGQSLISPEQMRVNDMQWRRTMILFLPVTASLRADPRFKTLCENTKLSAYWGATGIGPDVLPSDLAYQKA